MYGRVQEYTSGNPRYGCSGDEVQRMGRSIQIKGKHPNLVVEVDHPARLHDAFIAANAQNHGNRLLEAVELSDGWVRVAYAVGPHREFDLILDEPMPPMP